MIGKFDLFTSILEVAPRLYRKGHVDLYILKYTGNDKLLPESIMQSKEITDSKSSVV